MAAPTTFCPKHFTLEGVDCRDAVVDCPPRVPFDPDTHVLVACGPCKRELVVPVERIMKGRVHSAGQCQLDVCAGRVIHPQPEIKTETKTEFVEKKIPEGFELVTTAELEGLRQRPAPGGWETGIDQAAPSKASKGKATSGESKK